MAGVWPNLDLADLTARSRTYLNEATAKFYADAEFYRTMSLGAKRIAQEGSAVRRPLDAVTVSGTRTVTTSTYKVIHVEYIPSTGRSKMLRKIEPLQVGHKNLSGTAPQFWYELGNTIGIEPLPDAIYSLRLYVADLPKIQHTTYPLTNTQFTSWSAGGTGFTAATATHTGSVSGTLTENTSILAVSANYTVVFTLATASTFSATTIALGDTAGPTMTTAGTHTQNITTSATAAPKIIFTATGAVTFSNLYILKEANYSAVGDQTELSTMWQHLLSVIATSEGLKRDNRDEPGQILEALTTGEIAYLRSNILEIIPHGRNDRRPD